MADQSRFNEKWDFRRKENDFDDSSSDNPDSNSSHEPVLKKHKLVVTEAETVAKSITKKPQKSRGKKDEKKPEKGKTRGGVRKKTPRGKNEGDKRKKKKEETDGSKAGESIIENVGTFMETLLDDLKASRESLFDWMKGEIYQSEEKGGKAKRKTKVTRKRVQPQRVKRSVKKKNSIPEGEDKNDQREDSRKTEEKVAGETENTPREVQELSNVGLDCNIRPLERSRMINGTGYGKNYFDRQQNDQVHDVDHDAKSTRRLASIRKEKSKNLNQKSLVLGIPAQNSAIGVAEKLSKGKKPIESITVSPRDHQRDHPRRIHGDEMQKDTILNTSMGPNPPLLPAVSSNQGITSFTSNNFQLMPTFQTQDLTEIQTGSGFVHQGFRNFNGYHSNFALPFHQGFNFQTQLNPPEASLRDSNLFGCLRMTGGAIRFSGGGLPEQFSGADVRTSSDRLMPFQMSNNAGGSGSLFQN